METKTRRKRPSSKESAPVETKKRKKSAKKEEESASPGTKPAGNRPLLLLTTWTWRARRGERERGSFSGRALLPLSGKAGRVASALQSERRDRSPNTHLGVQGRLSVRRRFRKTTDSNHPMPVAPNVLNRAFDVGAVQPVGATGHPLRLYLARLAVPGGDAASKSATPTRRPWKKPAWFAA